MRDTKDFSGVLKEGSWVAACVVAAIAFCYFAPEYGGWWEHAVAAGRSQ